MPTGSSAPPANLPPLRCPCILLLFPWLFLCPWYFSLFSCDHDLSLLYEHVFLFQVNYSAFFYANFVYRLFPVSSILYNAVNIVCSPCCCCGDNIRVWFWALCSHLPFGDSYFSPFFRSLFIRNNFSRIYTIRFLPLQYQSSILAISR